MLCTPKPGEGGGARRSYCGSFEPYVKSFTDEPMIPVVCILEALKLEA